MPSPQQDGLLFLYNPLNAPQLGSPEAAAPLQSDWLQPEFCHILISLNMNVFLLVSIASIEEEPIRPNVHDGRHLLPC
jgi:hypothetical protein